MQQAGNLLMDPEERASRFRFPVRGPGRAVHRAFGAVLSGAGIEVVKILPCSPSANALAERVDPRDPGRRVTERMLIAGPRRLLAVLDEYAAQYDQHRRRLNRGQWRPSEGVWTDQQ